MSTLTILPRSEWNAASPTEQPERREPSSIHTFVIHWPGNTPASWRDINTKSEEAQTLRGFQRFHQQTRGWFDIGYNLLLGGGRDGNTPRVWTARGAQYTPAAQLKHNTGTLACVVLVGPNDPITDEIITRLRSIIRWAEEYTGNRLIVRGHTEVEGQDTECPGNGLLHIIDSGKLNIHR